MSLPNQRYTYNLPGGDLGEFPFNPHSFHCPLKTTVNGASRLRIHLARACPCLLSKGWCATKIVEVCLCLFFHFQCQRDYSWCVSTPALGVREALTPAMRTVSKPVLRRHWSPVNKQWPRQPARLQSKTWPVFVHSEAVFCGIGSSKMRSWPVRVEVSRL